VLMSPSTFIYRLSSTAHRANAFMVRESSPAYGANHGDGSGRLALVRWADGILLGAIPTTPIPAAAIPSAPVPGDTGEHAGVGARDDAGNDTADDTGNNAGDDTASDAADDAGNNVAGDAAGDAGDDARDEAAPGNSTRGAARATSRQAALRLNPAQTIVYHSCPECCQATVETQDSLVRISPKRVAELAPQAHSVTIAPEEELIAEVLPAGESDPPSTSRLARQVLRRDGQRCQNPGCDSWRNLPAHHIVYGAAGGRTVLSNEVTVCDQCHALVHAGLLEVTGHPGEGLTWTPRPMAPGAKVRDAQTLRQRLQELARTLPPAPRPAAPLSALSARVHAESTVGVYAPRTNDTLGAAEESTAVDFSRRTNSGTFGAAAESTAVDFSPRTNSGTFGAAAESTAVDFSRRTNSGTLGAAEESTAVDFSRRTNSGTFGAAAESTAVDFSPRTNSSLRTARLSARADSNPQLRDLAEGLRELGCSRADSVRLVEAAMEEFIRAGNNAPSDEDMRRRALQYWGRP
jgi:hypothetical protein